MNSGLTTPLWSPPHEEEVGSPVWSDMDGANEAAEALSDNLSCDGEEGPWQEAPSGNPRLIVGLLTFFGGIGGFLFGYDTGVIAGALPYIREEMLIPKQHGDLVKMNFYQGLVVSAAVIGAAFGAGAGGMCSDKFGRKKTLLLGDILFAVGALVMAAANSALMLIAGRLLVGLGIGLASVTVPVYIAEAAPREVRATLVTVNVLMITFGQFCAYLFDWAFTYMPGTWRWMLGVAAIPALLQFVGLFFLPESPRWLASKGHLTQARRILRQLRPPVEAENDMEELLQALQAEGPKGVVPIFVSLRSPEVRDQLKIGLGLQILQQLCGINTVMYYTPAILELAGFRDKRQALLVALAPAGINAIGTLVGMWKIDRWGRRKLLLTSVSAVFAALALLGLAFFLAENDSPPVAVPTDPALFDKCMLPPGRWDCMTCMRQGCGFCGTEADPMTEGRCMRKMIGRDLCVRADGFALYDMGCPSHYTILIIAALMAYIAAFSPGLGCVPWAVNAEIYPVQLRGVASGAAATANWVTNAVVSQTFLWLTQIVSTSGTFWIYSAIALAGLVWVYAKLPETSGLSLREVQQLFAAKYAKKPTMGARVASRQSIREDS